MRFVLKSPLAGTREAYRLHKDSDSCYPKGSRSVRTTVVANGEPLEIHLTNSGAWATKKTSGSNGWIRFEGKVYWFLFDRIVDAKEITNVEVTIDDGLADAPAKRDPRDAKKEALRVQRCKETFRAKRNPAAEEPAPTTEEQQEPVEA